MIYRCLRTQKMTLSRTFTSDDDVSPADGVVSVSVARLDGTVVSSGTATAAGSTYSYVFPGRDVLDTLTVTWSLAIGGDPIVIDSDVIEVVGAFYFSIAQGRDVDSALANIVKYPKAKMVNVRAQVEEECERITGQAWVPRFARVTLSGNDRGVLALPNTMIRTLRSVSSNGAAQAIDGLSAADVGTLTRGARSATNVWPRGSNNIVAEYEHGHDRPNPDILRAALLRFKSLALEGKSALADRAERTVTVDAQTGGSVVYGSPQVDKTGIPAVDAAYARWPSPQPGFG